MNHEQLNPMNMKEREIFENAIHSIEGLTDVKVEDIVFTQGQDTGYDGMLNITFGKNQTAFKFQLKGEIRSTERSFIRHKESQPDAFLLICQYIPKPLKDQLKEAEINYLEATGNCYIKTNQIYLYINDQPVTAMRLPAEGKLWKPPGIKFLFAVLRNQDILNFPYRQIADEANVALGSIGPLMEELEKENYLSKRKVNGKHISVLEGKSKLIQRWAVAYQNTLKPRLAIGAFKFANQRNMEDWQNILPEDFLWGGEAAGAILTNYLVPGRLTIYTKKDKLSLMKQLRLIPDENGPVEVLAKFWGRSESEDTPTLHTVPPLLAYAELINNFDSRNTETAERIKEIYPDEFA